MKFKKLRKIYRVLFPKRFTPNTAFEYGLTCNPLVESFTKKSENYIVKLKKSLTVEIRGKEHSDYKVLQQVFNEQQYLILLSMIKLNQEAKERIFIIDAGANVGFTSLYFNLNLDNPLIFSVEPSRDNAEMCRRNFKLNDINENINLYHNALAHKSGQKFNIGKDFRDAQDWAITTEEAIDGEISGVTVKELIQKAGSDYISLLKIDIEGAERFIFSTDSDLSFLDRTRILAIEIHDEFEIRETIYSELRKRNFKLFELGELTLAINSNL